MAWNRMVRNGTERHGMAQDGTERHDVERNGTEWYETRYGTPQNSSSFGTGSLMYDKTRPNSAWLGTSRTNAEGKGTWDETEWYGTSAD